MSLQAPGRATMRTRRGVVVAGALVGGLLFSACGAGPTATPPTVRTPSPPVTASSPPPTTTTQAGPAPAAGTTAVDTARPAPATAAPTAAPAGVATSGCAPMGSGIPAGAARREIIDVDGDGRPDTGWIEGGTTFGITTASGATFTIPIDLAGGGPRSVLVENPDSTGTIAALASDGRTAELLVVRNCALFPVTNAQGGHYQFDLGFRGTGTGVGCSQITGTSGRSLVGLNMHLDGAGQPHDVGRTQVIITATTARNGATDTVPTTGNPAAAASANTISCGDLTIRHDGVTEQH